MRRLATLLMFTVAGCAEPPPAASPSASAGSAPSPVPASTPLLAQPDPSPHGRVVATGVSVEVRARVLFVAAPAEEEPVSEIGSAATIRYDVENTGRTDLTVWHAGFWPNHRIVVAGPTGAAPALLPLGKAGAAAFSPRGMRDKNVEWKIKPGAVDASEGAFDLAELYDLSAPGRYTVRVDYEEDIAFSSNTLPFWRVRAGALEPLRKLAGWDRGDVDVFERPAAHPGQAQTGESQGFITAQKEALRRLGVEVSWDAAAARYRITSSR